MLRIRTKQLIAYGRHVIFVLVNKLAYDRTKSFAFHCCPWIDVITKN